MLAVKDKVRGSEVCARISGVLLGECAKKKREYRIGALKSAITFMKEFGKDLEQGGQALQSVSDVFERASEGQHSEGAGRQAVSAGRDADAEEQYQAKLVCT
jgi:hypothetical protein